MKHLYRVCAEMLLQPMYVYNAKTRASTFEPLLPAGTSITRRVDQVTAAIILVTSSFDIIIIRETKTNTNQENDGRPGFLLPFNFKFLLRTHNFRRDENRRKE